MGLHSPYSIEQHGEQIRKKECLGEDERPHNNPLHTDIKFFYTCYLRYSENLTEVHVLLPKQSQSSSFPLTIFKSRKPPMTIEQITIKLTNASFPIINPLLHVLFKQVLCQQTDKFENTFKRITKWQG
jgi:hypothetical protein